MISKKGIKKATLSIDEKVLWEESFDFDNKRTVNIGALGKATYCPWMHKIVLKMLNMGGNEYKNEAYLKMR